ncbi:NAD(P)H-hydrate dehydratase [Clostridium sp. Ade.TY]|uniref:NAD(P)H-hydrate dehydratase n=1 Tax=Clostridium sp. Ade.TY TaxID=1391647 RepID=UPI0004053218|nr:NAD(P)H-hydrate dehydratase [Clostridium sp. Ade.TY]
MEILSRKTCMNIDKETINHIGIPSIVLMENAANSITEEIKNFGNNVIIFAGIGNNGGDGLAISRKLTLLNKSVKVVLVGNTEKLTEDNSINLKIVENLNIPVIKVNKLLCLNDKEYIKKIIKDSDYVVDAIFGVGLNREIKGIYKEVIDLINQFSNFTVSIDIPSGLDADTGETLGMAVKANNTFTIEFMKKGFFQTKAVNLIGDIKIVKIDIPKFIKEKNSEKTYIISRDRYKKMIPIRDITGHKGTYGKVLIVAGSKKYSGAAFITTEACVRTGSGLVTLLTHKYIADSLKSRLIEAMVNEYSNADDIKALDKFDVIACGPGFSTEKESIEILYKIIKESKCKLVLDADALNIISENKDMLNKLKGRTIITPHPGELARLIGVSINEIESNRIDITRSFAKKHEIIVLLKGYNTVISDGTNTFVNTTGNSKMASGGMGDCLTGIVASFLGQQLSMIDATLLGAYIHGYIGDELSRCRYSVNARDIIEELPKTIEKLCEN